MGEISDRLRRLLTRTEQVGDYVRLTVQDSGVGFDSSTADRMFESFFTTKPDGMGIGLSVCRSIISPSWPAMGHSQRGSWGLCHSLQTKCRGRRLLPN